jgi:SPFH domain / Band 7 family
MLSERKKLSTDVQSIIDSQTETWGIKVSNVEIRTVELTENMVRAIAKQAEAERDRRAKIIHAEAEFQASQTLVNAAKILSSVPAAMQLRYLQTLAEIGAEQNSTVVFPMPIDIIKPFLEILEKTGKPADANGGSRLPAKNGASLDAQGHSRRLVDRGLANRPAQNRTMTWVRPTLEGRDLPRIDTFALAKYHFARRFLIASNSSRRSVLVLG